MVKRYNILPQTVDESKTGPWVRYEDHEAEILADQEAVVQWRENAEKAEAAYYEAERECEMHDEARVEAEKRAQNAERERDELLVTNAHEIGKRKDVERERDELRRLADKYRDDMVAARGEAESNDACYQRARIARANAERERDEAVKLLREGFELSVPGSGDQQDFAERAHTFLARLDGEGES